jgi:hypothetical protein
MCFGSLTGLIMNITALIPVAALIVLSQAVSRPAVAQATHDRLTAEISNRESEFGGMFFDEKGDLVVYLVGAGEQDTQGAETRKVRVEAAITAAFGPGSTRLRKILAMGMQQQPGVQQAEIKIIKADYRIEQLLQWRARIDQMLSIPGVEFTHVDQSKNRLVIGVSSLEVRQRIETRLREVGVPLESVVIEETKPFEFDKTLRDKFRPVHGGVQIEGDVGTLKYKYCTFGFNAAREGDKGFVTNSHCTKTQGGSEGTDFHQPRDPWWTEGNKIGDETVDPSYFSGGVCPAGRRCRFSDSAFIRYKSEGWMGLGILARPEHVGSTLVIDSDSPTFRIMDEASSPIHGMRLDKVGRTTGWTSGRVTGTCLNVNVNKTDITLLCQAWVDAGPDSHNKGDSGSPVFQRLDGDTVILHGILWGGEVDGPRFSFSPMSGIERELGSLRTIWSASPPPPICPPSRPICCEPEGEGCRICIPSGASCP